MPSTNGGHCPFFISIISVLNLMHHSRSVLEANLVGSSHFRGGGIAHTVQYLVKHINLLLTQRLLKGYAELVKLVRELSGVDFALAVVVKCINHNGTSFLSLRYTESSHITVIHRIIGVGHFECVHK